MALAAALNLNNLQYCHVTDLPSLRLSFHCGQRTVNIQDLIEAIRRHRIRITDHADEEAQADRLSFEEIFFSVFQGEIIEEYPDDTPYPSCLVYGESFKGESIRNDGSTGVPGEKHDAVQEVSDLRR